MNERIKELIDQCSEYDEMSLGIWFNKEKFAELLLQECDDVIKKEVSMKYYKNSDKSDEFASGHYTASVLARLKIKEHFGISE